MSVTHLTKLSGGRASAVTSALVGEAEGVENCAEVFTDTLIEDNDLYRFLIEFAGWKYGVNVTDLLPRALALPQVWEDEAARKAALADLRAEATARVSALHWIGDGRHPFEVFRDKKMMGSNRVDPCSAILKRKLSDDYTATRWTAETCVLYVGIGYHERHRFYGGKGKRGIRALVRPWDCRSPLAEMAGFGVEEMDDCLTSIGVRRPRLYDDGFANNNCGGACVKAGHASWARLWRTNPRYYLWWEEQEERFRRDTGKLVAILRDRRGGRTRPLTLRRFRELLDTQMDITPLLIASDHGCGGSCMFPSAAERRQAKVLA